MKFHTRTMYEGLTEIHNSLRWRKLMMGNPAKSRAICIMWRACHERMATKNWLAKFGIIQDTKCYVCMKGESINHIMFQCQPSK